MEPGTLSINDIDWLVVWKRLAEIWQSSHFQKAGVRRFLEAVATVFGELAAELAEPWHSFFAGNGAWVGMMSSTLEASYMDDVPWEDFIMKVGVYLEKEDIEPGRHSGTTLWEVLEGVAWEMDQTLRVGPLVMVHLSPHEEIRGMRKPISMSAVLSPLALLMRRIAQWFGEKPNPGESIPPEVLDPHWQPEPGSPWSMPND